MSRLPNELLIAILNFTLSQYGSYHSHFNMEILYIMRAVSKRWQDIVDGTPSFWTTILSTLPAHVIEVAILRSSPLPLSVVYNRPWNPKTSKFLSARTFLDIIADTRPRWSTLVLDFDDTTALPGYLGAPSPLLQTIVVGKPWLSSFTPNPNIEPMEFLGGRTADLRLVHLWGVSIDLSGCHFTQLTRLILKSVVNHGMTGSQLLDVFRANPDLQVLELGDISFDIPPFSSIVTLNSLQYIGLKYCDADLVAWILGQIRAPSCTTLRLLTDNETDGAALMDESLGAFYETLLRLHKNLGGSEILLSDEAFLWRTSEYFDYEEGWDLCSNEGLYFNTQEGPGSNTEEGLWVLIYHYSDPFYPHWVDQILQNEPGLRIGFGNRAESNKQVLESIAPMRSVTTALIREAWDREMVCKILRFLSQPLPKTTSLPSLPCLQELQIDLGSWHTQDLLDMVQTRFAAVSWDVMERTPLVITVACDYRMSRRGRSMLDFATLTEIRRTIGVECVRFERHKSSIGMLAVTWDEKLSQPVWC